MANVPAPYGRLAECAEAVLADRTDAAPNSSWRAEVHALTARIQTELAELAGGGNQAALDNVLQIVLTACGATHPPRRLLARLRSWFTGSDMALALSSLHAAQEALLLHQPPDAFAATATEVEATVRATLPAGDPRREAFLSRPTRVSGSSASDDAVDRADRQDRRMLVTALRAANEAARAAATRLVALRNTVILGAALLTAVVAGIAVVAALSPELVPVCQASGSGSTACPSGAAHPTGADVALIELMGVLGGVLAGVLSLASGRDEPRPPGLLAALTFLKVPVAAATALLGVLVLQDDGALVDASLHTGGATLTTAALLGAGQQAVTGLVDRAARKQAEPLPITRHAPDVQKKPPPL
jgi:hypothetical protein